MVNGWKITAIIFIVLFTLQCAFIIWGVTLAVDAEDKEADCSWNVCEDYASYRYYPYDKFCQCFEDGEVVKTAYLTG